MVYGNMIFSLGEERLLTVEKKNIRISRDWVDNKWVDIPGKPNICSYLPSNVSSSMRPSANSAVVDGSMSDCSAKLESKPPSIPKVEVAQKVERPASGLEAPDDLESTKGITLGKPLHAIHEDKDNNTDGGCDGDGDNVDDRKQLHAIDEENKDNNSGGGGEGDSGNDGGGNIADNAEENREENLMEGNFDCAEPKLDAAEAIKVT